MFLVIVDVVGEFSVLCIVVCLLGRWFLEHIVPVFAWQIECHRENNFSRAKSVSIHTCWVCFSFVKV